MQLNKIDWSVIYTRPNHEKAVQKQLDSIKIQNYLPIVKTLKSSKNKKKSVNQIMFPSYIFAKPDDVHQYFDSLRIPGILYYLRTGSRIAVIRESVIDGIKLLSERNAGARLEISNENIAKGKILNITKGPFRGIACEVVQCKSTFKIVVRIELLRRSVLVDLTSDCLSY
jgi:transcription antitermination factor NusG